MQIGEAEDSRVREPTLSCAVDSLNRCTRPVKLEHERAGNIRIAGGRSLVDIECLRPRLINQQGTVLVHAGKLKLNVTAVSIGCGLYGAPRSKPKTQGQHADQRQPVPRPSYSFAHCVLP